MTNSIKTLKLVLIKGKKRKKERKCGRRKRRVKWSNLLWEQHLEKFPGRGKRFCFYHDFPIFTVTSGN